MSQTHQEILNIFTEWMEHFAPANLDKDSQKNGKLLANYVLDKFERVSITNLTEAYKVLASALDHLPEPKPKTAAEVANEFEKKERARIRREAEDNLKKAKGFDNLNVLDTKDPAFVEAKRQADAQKSIEGIVARYTVNGQTPGTLDAKRTEAGRAALKAIRILNKVGGTTDWVTTLRVVQDSFHYDSVGEIRAAAQRALDRITHRAEDEHRKAEQGKMGAGAGHLPRYY